MALKQNCIHKVSGIKYYECLYNEEQSYDHGAQIVSSRFFVFKIMPENMVRVRNRNRNRNR